MSTHPTTATSHILVVDDEPEIAESLAAFLSRQAGYAISLASNGRQAIDFLKRTFGTKTEIDLVLLDMRMPGLSGLDVLDWIRKHPDLQYTRVVLLTAASGKNEKIEALSAGADDYITKPYYMQELLARVKTILRTQQLEKQLQLQSQQLAALNRVGQIVSSTLDAEEVLRAAVKGIAAVLAVECTAVLMSGSGYLHCRHLRHSENRINASDFDSISQESGLLGDVFSNQTQLILNNPLVEANFLPATDVPNGLDLQSLIAMPLLVRGRSVGVMVAFNKQNGTFTNVDFDLFASLSSSISDAIENSWLFQRIRLRQHELLQNRNTLQALIDGIPHPIYTIDEAWQIVSVNKSKVDQQEQETEALVGQICFKTFYNRSEPCEHCQAGKTINEKNAQNWPVRWEGDDHLPREWEVDAYPIPSQKLGTAQAVIVWQDKTEKRRLEDSLMRAGKLAAIGQLAAGVAHEINNPLTAVNANAEMLKMVIPKDDDNYEAVELIALAGERATRVVRGLLDFSRQENYAFTYGEVNTSLEDTLSLIRYQLQSSQINIITTLDDDLPPITASWEHLKSVWINLLLNARDALENNEIQSHIEIVTRKHDEGQFIQVLIHDNGKGISAAEAQHIFEPFYTTKDPGKGTGLGLATCHRIVEQHGGDINVVSTPNKGTTFIIHLPIGQGRHA